jgi:hypothetical protein
MFPIEWKEIQKGNMYRKITLCGNDYSISTYSTSFTGDGPDYYINQHLLNTMEYHVPYMRYELYNHYLRILSED